MQSLGLSSETKRSDGWLKSLLWPSVENAWDVDYLGQQGMWVCTVVAVFTLVTTVFSGVPIAIFLGVFSALFYVIGGMGVREANWPAAAIVFSVYVLDILYTVASLHIPSIFTIAFAIVLFSNLRSTFLAAEWKPSSEGEDRPTRFSESFSDKYVDQMPRILWPKLQIPFIVLGVAMLLFSLVGVGLVLARRFGVLPHG